jgi:NAD(P)-dependent dehydrogenase (short-subunit alcohol dehydrogenase family)
VVALATIKTSGTGEKKKTLARSAKRFGKEVAAAVVFLASDDASCITGVELAVDCGRTL